MFPQIKKNKPQEVKKIKIGKKSLAEATSFVQEIVTDNAVWGPDKAMEHQRILELAQSGDIAAIKQARQLIRKIIIDYWVEVEGYNTDTLTERVYSYAWGLDVLEKLYWDDTIDEIRVNSPEQVFVQMKGKNKKVNVEFKGEEHIKRILGRLFIHDRGVSLTTSTPIVESIRLDGTRVTAMCPPVAKTSTFILRKHGTFKMTPENLIKAGTLNEQLLDLLSTLVKGRVNILISGGTGTGKTSLMRFLVRYIDSRLHIVTLETDSELNLSEYYADREITEMEEHQELGIDMRKLFRTALRYSPDIIFVGEIRGKGEAVEAVKACTRGHEGSMATIHFNSVQDAIEGYGKMMLEEGVNLSLDVANLWVAQAFSVVIQMFTDTTKGTKKITRVTEIGTEGNKISYRDLAVWEPSSGEYFKGQWVFPNPPSRKLLERISRYNSPSPSLMKVVSSI